MRRPEFGDVKRAWEISKKPLLIFTPIAATAVLVLGARYLLGRNAPSGLVISADCFNKNSMSLMVDGVYYGTDLNRGNVKYWLYLSDLTEGQSPLPIGSIGGAETEGGGERFTFRGVNSPAAVIRGLQGSEKQEREFKPGDEISIEVVRAVDTPTEVLPQGEVVVAGLVKPDCTTVITKGGVPVPTPKAVPEEQLQQLKP